MPQLRTAPRRLVAAAGALLLGTALTAAATPPARAAAPQDVGYVRLAHLSPDTPAVDVYLSAPGAAEPRVFPAVGYGVVSDYLPLAAGRYAVAMREAGAPASQPPVLTTEVAVEAGAAYTVAGVGRHADLGLRVLADDLSAPAPGQAKVRVVQASVRAPVIDVAATDGPAIADAVRFATTTDYREVEPGRWRLRLGGDNGPTTDAEVTLSGGRAYSLLVLDGRRGGLATELREDARGGAVIPAGGVPAGAGGLAGRGLGAYPMVAGALLAAAVVVGAALLVRRRRRPVW
ncbi:uncharacterized protein DUF4397 [Micromonospora palomenae]|uniref:Uncharacterized protein DUF4397 n=1 Tax=Micromonospora palomenae TaxID=1461247 RepID=A0A561VFW0_9ACTN|nr:DUF4397 domain-containing protein [Micromonospora palomenae]TWG10502.1 uncharacterized protein DUF4397 [Micromonospora palomenae]